MLQDYPGNWIVQVIDNNTPDQEVWMPVRDFCQRFGDRVQFLHLEQWPGYKAGALNEGTRRLPDWVEVVAVVDADYLVEPNFLRATARHFANPEVALVQTPQHYRGWRGIPYFEGLNYLYEYFFALSMVSRRELRSVVCFGTMCLIRRSALLQVGGWDEASITEDVELSVRLLGRGWRGVYDHRSYGAGLMPLDFGALKKQRFRWAFGTIQTLKKHWRLLLGLSEPSGYSLTLTQRWCFLVLSLQYLAEVPAFLFAFLLVMTVLLSVLGSPLVPPALSVALFGPLLLLVIANARTIWALRETTGCTRSQAIAALVFFLSLSWITARACFSAFVHRTGVFLRTPKLRGRQKWQQAVLICKEEIALSLLYLGTILLAVQHHWREQSASLVSLLLQAVICAGAVICAFASEGIGLFPRSLFGTYQSRLAPMKKTVSSVLPRSSRTAAGHRAKIQWREPGAYTTAPMIKAASKYLTSPVAQRRYTQRLRKLMYSQLA
jgi:cellulose synthase/poly-beta-1,6-N-acetylglucosamine synthase-like glycosyltransferase